MKTCPSTVPYCLVGVFRGGSESAQLDDELDKVQTPGQVILAEVSQPAENGHQLSHHLPDPVGRFDFEAGVEGGEDVRQPRGLLEHRH